VSFEPVSARHGDPEDRWIDAHCHLQERYGSVEGGAEDRLADAVADGVVGVVCVGTDVATSRQAVDLARRHADGPTGCWVRATMGVHPHEAEAGTEDLQALVEEVVGAPDGGPRSRLVVAVGECGLDYHYDHAPRAVQRAVFAEQVALAHRWDLALVIHTREAWDDTLDILKAEGPPERTVVHCFTGGPTEAARCLDLGAHLSFSGIVTFKNAEDVRQAARLCPADRLMVETDAPFLAPVPHRGRPNQPAWVRVVGHAIAEVRGESVATVSATTRQVTQRVFGLPELNG
jgi:TatD DNase family protein